MHNFAGQRAKRVRSACSTVPDVFIEQRLSTQIKYEIDGQVFYDKKEYDSYVWKKEWAQREKRDKIKVAVVSTLSCLFIGGVGLLLLIMMGII